MDWAGFICGEFSYKFIFEPEFDSNITEKSSGLLKLFSATINSLKFLQDLSPCGKAPTRLLSKTLKTSICLRFPRFSEILPLNWLLLKWSCFKFERFPNDSGMFPFKAVPLIAKTSNFSRLPNSLGISPEMGLNESSSFFKFFKFPKDAGSFPFKLLNSKLIPVTLLFSMVIPCQVSTGFSRFHGLFQFEPSVAEYRFKRTCFSSLLTCAKTTAAINIDMQVRVAFFIVWCYLGLSSVKEKQKKLKHKIIR